MANLDGVNSVDVSNATPFATLYNSIDVANVIPVVVADVMPVVTLMLFVYFIRTASVNSDQFLSWHKNVFTLH